MQAISIEPILLQFYNVRIIFLCSRTNCKEMLEYMAPIVGNPGAYWNYRDESFVGYWASASHQRGGANMVATVVPNFLNRYRALLGFDDD